MKTRSAGVLTRIGREFRSHVWTPWSRSREPEERGPVVAQPASPRDAATYLRRDNPRLRELTERYSKHPIASDPSVWTDDYLAAELDLTCFRGDNAYIWQTRNLDNAQQQYLETARYCRRVDALGAYELLLEDGLFGAVTWRERNRLISRDLLDSLLELNFLERHLRLSRMQAPTFLDIGAGYGRLAHRILEAVPHTTSVLCTDAVATSTFICEYYLRYRGVHKRARTVPIYDIEDALREDQVDIVINIESFSECPLSSISWWLDLVASCGARYLFLVPDYRDLLVSRESDRSTRDFRPLVEARGFELVASEPIYGNDRNATRRGLYPNRAHMLFRRRNAYA